MSKNLTNYIDKNGTPIKYGDIISFEGNGEIGIVMKCEHNKWHKEPQYALFWPEEQEFGQSRFYLEDWENDPIKKDIDHEIIGNILDVINN